MFCRDLAEAIAGVARVSVVHIYFSRRANHVEESITSDPERMLTTVSVALPRSSWFVVNQWRYYRALFRHVARIRRADKAHLIHAQVPWKSGWDAFLLSGMTGLPYLVTEHQTGWLPEDDSLRGWKKRLSLFILRRAEAVVAVSERLAGCMQPFLRKKVSVIANVIHPVFTSAEVLPEPENPVFLHVSNFREHHKQTGAIIRMFSRLATEMPQAGLWLNVPVTEFEAFKSAHPDLAWEQIRLLPPVPDRQSLAERMSQSTCIISFSRFETFGLTLAESACMGVPAIYTRCGGADLFYDEHSGISCDAGDEQSLLNAMRDAVRPGRFDRKRIATAAREYFDSRKVVDSYLNRYLSIIS